MGTRCEWDPGKGEKEWAMTTHLWVSATRSKESNAGFSLSLSSWGRYTGSCLQGIRKRVESRPKDPDGAPEGERSWQAGEAGVVCGLREEVGPRNAVSTSSSREGKRKGQVNV